MLGFGSLYNHSSTPNSVIKFINEETANIYAIKDINSNEELFNYGDDYL
jgi:SET domain-containing protein